MARIEPPESITFRKVLNERRVTNWPAITALAWGWMCVLALVGTLFAWFQRDRYPYWYVGFIVALVAFLGARYWARVARWRHHVATTLDPDGP